MKLLGLKKRFKHQRPERLFVVSVTIADTAKKLAAGTQQTIKRPQTAIHGALIPLQNGIGVIR